MFGGQAKKRGVRRGGPPDLLLESKLGSGRGVSGAGQLLENNHGEAKLLDGGQSFDPLIVYFVSGHIALTWDYTPIVGWAKGSPTT